MARKTDLSYRLLKLHRLLKLSLILSTLSQTFAVILREEPVSTEASYGDSVTLNCAVEGELEGVSVFWWNINTSRALSDNTRISPMYNFMSPEQKTRYSITGNSTNGEFNLRITGVTFEDRATYSCRIWDGTQWIFSRKVNINVIRETPVCSLQAITPVNVNDTVRLICRSYSTVPNVQLHWLSKGRLIKSTSPSTGQLAIQHVLTESDYDVPFMCLQTGAHQRKACQIVPLHRQISVIVQDRITSAYDGDSAGFQCTTGFAKESLSFTWYVNDIVVPDVTTDYLELPVNLSNNGSIITCIVEDSVSGLMGQNSAMLFVGPRPPTTTVSPTISNATTTNIYTTSSRLSNTKHGLKKSPLHPLTTSKDLLETKPENRSSISGETPGTKPPVLLEEIEIENPRIDGSGKSSPAPHNFMLAFIIGSVIIGTLLIILIAILLLFLVRQTNQRRSDRNSAVCEKDAHDGENMPLGADTEEAMDPNAGIIHKRSTKGKRVKETNVDYAILDPNAVEEEDTLSDFRICDELLEVNCDYNEPDNYNHEIVHRSYSAGIRDSIVSSVSAYAIADLPPPTATNKSPKPTSQQRSASCRSLQRPLPAEPVVKASPKRYTYMAPLELRNESNDRVNPVHTSPAVSPHVSQDHRKNCNLEALGEEDYAEINDIDQHSSVKLKQQEQKLDNEITRLKNISESERSGTPSVESQEADSALGSGSSMEALTSGDECLYATIGEEHSQNKINHTKEPVDLSTSANVDLSDMVVVSLKDIEEATTEQSNQTSNSHKSKVPVYAKVDKSKKRQKSLDSAKTGGPKSPKSPKDKVGKTLSWQSWLENVVSHGSTDAKKQQISSMEDGNEQIPAYATVWPHEQVTGSS